MGFWNTLGTIASSVLPGLGSAVGGIAGAKQSGRNVASQIKADREMAEYAYSKDLEMWQRQNEYNLPANQMKRMKDAGLNPNLMYGHGTSGQASEMPKYQSVKSDYSKRQNSFANLMTSLSMWNDFRLRNAQVDKAKEGARNTRIKNSLLDMRKNWMNRTIQMSVEPTTGESIYWKGKQYERLFDKEWELIERRNNALSAKYNIDMESAIIRKIEREWYDIMKRYTVGSGIGRLAIPLIKSVIGK